MSFPLVVLAAISLALPRIQMTGVRAKVAREMQGLWAGIVPVEPGCSALQQKRLSPSQEAAFQSCGELLPCLVTAGRAAHAGKVMVGSIEGHDGRFGMTLLLVDVRSGKITHVASRTANAEADLAPSLSSGVAEVCATVGTRRGTEVMVASQFPTPPSHSMPPDALELTHATTPASASTKAARTPDAPPSAKASSNLSDVFALPPDNPPASKPPATVSLALPPSTVNKVTRPMLFHVLPIPRSRTAVLGAEVSAGTSGGLLLMGIGFAIGTAVANSQAASTNDGSLRLAYQTAAQDRGYVADASFGLSAAMLATAAAFWFAGDAVFPPSPGDSTPP